ncbi:hypothetical protein LXA43DRAFT_212365 [Ganoderma leucocontextum]|nr:hypothetical protein LXA43DRAFT_212365 [Ganoderma leucocontextum]
MTTAMDSKVVQLPLREFADKLLPVPRELVSAQFPPRKMARITEAFADMIENYERRAWGNDHYDHPEDQLAVEFTQIINEHVLGHVAEMDVVQPEGSIPASSAAESTESTTGGSCQVAETGDGSLEGRGTCFVDNVSGYVMKVFAHKGESETRGDRHEVRRFDDEHEGGDEEEEDEDDEDDQEEDNEDDRIRSGAGLFKREFQPELVPDEPNWPYQGAFVQFTQDGVHNDPFDFSPLPGNVEVTADNDDSHRGWVLPCDFHLLQGDTEIVADNRERIRSRMQSCADSLSLYQHRTAVFSLVVIHREFRVMRWDPSGVFVSERVDYVRDTRALIEVLLAFIVSGSEAQGYDPTATLLTKDSEDYELMDRLVEESHIRIPVLPWAEGTRLPPTIPVQTYATFTPGAVPPLDANSYLVDDAHRGTPPPEGEANRSPAETTFTTRRILKDGSFVFQYVLDYFRRSLALPFLRYNLKVGGDEFLVTAPLYYTDRFGGTRGYVAFHKQSGRLVFLKDSWRPHYHGIKPEGDILHTLNEDEVRNVPTLLCHGVVEGQVTQVLDYWMDSEDRRAREERKKSAAGAAEDGPRGLKRARDNQEGEEMPRIHHYVHHRTALKEVCLPLTACTSSRQLVSVVGDTIEAHHDVMEKSKLTHRNISSESIAILPTFVEPDGGDDDSTLRVVWRGILGEWESATRIPAHGAYQSTQQPERTPAAWRHMSVASLTEGFDITSLRTADKVESFFHVILHHAIRFCPHNVDVTEFIDSTFITHTRQSDGGVRCPWNKMNILKEHGVLKFYGKKVVFYGQPGQPRSHNAPLHTLLSTLLKWFKARYDILDYEKSPQLASISVTPSSSNSDLPAKRQCVEPEPPNEAVITDGGPSASVEDDWQSEPVRPSDQTYELASRVDDQKAVSELFRQVRSMDWPENDVVGDQWIRVRRFH